MFVVGHIPNFREKILYISIYCWIILISWWIFRPFTCGTLLIGHLDLWCPSSNRAWHCGISVFNRPAINMLSVSVIIFHLIFEHWSNAVKTCENMWKHVKTCENMWKQRNQNHSTSIFPPFPRHFLILFPPWQVVLAASAWRRPKHWCRSVVGIFGFFSKGKERRWFQEMMNDPWLWWFMMDLWWFMMIYDDLWWLITNFNGKITNNVPFSREGFQGKPDFSALVEFEMIPKSAASQCRQVELGMKRLVLSSKNGNLPDEQGVAQRVQAAVAALILKQPFLTDVSRIKLGDSWPKFQHVWLKWSGYIWMISPWWDRVCVSPCLFHDVYPEKMVDMHWFTAVLWCSCHDITISRLFSINILNIINPF